MNTYFDFTENLDTILPDVKFHTSANISITVENNTITDENPTNKKRMVFGE